MLILLTIGVWIILMIIQTPVKVWTISMQLGCSMEVWTKCGSIWCMSKLKLSQSSKSKHKTKFLRGPGKETQIWYARDWMNWQTPWTECTPSLSTCGRECPQDHILNSELSSLGWKATKTCCRMDLCTKTQERTGRMSKSTHADKLVHKTQLYHVQIQ